MSRPKRVVLDCERMKYPHTGLYHYCLNLGKNLLKTNTDNKELCFFTPRSVDFIFGKDACYLHQNSFQKFMLPSTKNFDLWHVTYQSSLYIPKKRKIKLLLTIHDLNFWYDEKKSTAKKEKYIRNIQQNIKSADHVVTISEYVKRDIENHIGLFGKQCTVIYNGCNIETIDQLKKPAIMVPKPFLFTIGTIVEKKNFHVLPCLLAENDMYLVIAGITQSEPYKNKIIAMAREWKVENRLIFTGAISENDKQWYLKNCAAFVFPSLAEGFGLPVIEAMHFGIPVILSSCTSLPEIGGKEAYYFSSFEPEDMQKTLMDSLKDYRENNRENAIRNRSEFFNWKKSALQYHSLYNELLQ